MRGCVVRSRKGSCVDRNSWGERSGAPAGERFPTFPHRGHPGGTVGTTTGRPQGLNPARMRGVEPAGRRTKIAAAGARRAPHSFAEYRTAFAGRPPPPRHKRRGAPQETEEGRRPDRDRTKRRDREARNAHSSVQIARENGDAYVSCRPRESEDPVIANARSSIPCAGEYWVPARWRAPQTPVAKPRIPPLARRTATD